MENIVIGIFYSILAGLVVATQNIFSAKISEKVGMLETTVVVYLTGAIIGLIITFIFGKGSFKEISEVNKIYLLAGMLGIIIIFSVAMGVTKLGSSYSIALMVISQLIFATIIDTLGLFGSNKIPLNFTKVIGIIVMIIGVLIFRMKG